MSSSFVGQDAAPYVWGINSFTAQVTNHGKDDGDLDSEDADTDTAEGESDEADGDIDSDTNVSEPWTEALLGRIRPLPRL